jgi:hypothetical protein
VTAAILRLHWLLSVLMVAATALFAIGVAAERGQHDHDSDSAHVEGAGEENHDESTETGSHESGEENTFGIDTERPAIVVPAVVASLAMAVVVWFRRDIWLMWTVAVFALLFAAFDVVEVIHQLSDDRGGLALLAAVVAVFHLAAAFVAETRATHSPANASGESTR